MDVAPYLEYPVAVRSRTNMTVKTMAIKMSTTAATERDEVAILCSPNAEVVGLEHEIYAYHEETVTEHKELNGVYARGERLTYRRKPQSAKETNEPIRTVERLHYIN